VNKIIGIILVLTVAIFAKDAPKIGQPSPQFQGTTFNGKKIHLTDFKGKVVLIDFWASWCGPCRQEIPFLIELKFHYRHSPLEIIAINIDKNIQNAREFVDQLPEKINFTVIKDSKQQIPPKYQIKGMPTSILLDKDGIIRYWHTGFKKSYEKEYFSEIDKLLKENPATDHPGQN